MTRTALTNGYPKPKPEYKTGFVVRKREIIPVMYMGKDTGRKKRVYTYLTRCGEPGARDSENILMDDAEAMRICATANYGFFVYRASFLVKKEKKKAKKGGTQ